MSENMKLWNAVKQPPKSALKTIGAGRLKGMTDINPQWRLQVMTEQFGQCGIGWYYEIVRMWTEPGASGEVMAFVHIHLHTWVKDDMWSQPIVGIGGSALVAKESAGLRANDEAFKMALTDALSVAMKQLGVAADIYAGRYDGSKYKDEVPASNGSNYDANGKVKPGNVTPSIAVQEWEKLDEEGKNFLSGIAIDIIAAIDATDIDTAHALFYKNNLDHDEQVALWSRLDSKKRSTIKAHQDKLVNGTLPV